MSESKHRFRNPRLKRNRVTSDTSFIPTKPNIRENHRDYEFEGREDLLDERYNLTKEVDEIRKENEKMKLIIIEKTKEYQINEEVKIEFSEKTGEQRNKSFQIKKYLQLSQQLNDLNIEDTELDAQFDFIKKYYSDDARHELSANLGLQSQKEQEFNTEITQMQTVINKANERIKGPVAEQKKLFLKRKKQIRQLKAKYGRLLQEERNIEVGNIISYKNQILPEELEAVVQELKHKLEILKHRKFNREKELKEMKARHKMRNQNMTEIKCLRNAAENEENERVMFRNKMQKIHAEQKEEEYKRYLKAQWSDSDCEDFENAVVLVDENEEEENSEDAWKPITFAKEAHE